jgi:hypothetical protein
MIRKQPNFLDEQSRSCPGDHLVPTYRNLFQWELSVPERVVGIGLQFAEIVQSISLSLQRHHSHQDNPDLPCPPKTNLFHIQ